MKYSKTAIGLLTAQYRSVLKKCLMINLGLFALGAVATATSANAQDFTETVNILNTQLYVHTSSVGSGLFIDGSNGVFKIQDLSDAKTVFQIGTDGSVSLGDTTKSNFLTALGIDGGGSGGGSSTTYVEGDGIAFNVEEPGVSPTTISVKLQANSYLTKSGYGLAVDTPALQTALTGDITAGTTGAGFVTGNAINTKLQDYATTTALNDKQDALSSAQISRINGAVVGAKINGGSTINPDENGILALTDANTEYSAGKGLALDGTTFSVKPTTTNSGLSVTDAGVAVSGITDANVDSISTAKITGLGTMAAEAATDYAKLNDDAQTITSKAYKTANWTASEGSTGNLLLQSGGKNAAILRADGSFTLNGTNGQVFDVAKDGKITSNSDLVLGYKTDNQATLTGAKVKSYDAAVADLPNKYNWSNIIGAAATETAGAEEVSADTAVYSARKTDDLLGAKANAADVYTKTEADDLLGAKANAADVYTKTEADDLLGAKANAADLALKADLTNTEQTITAGTYNVANKWTMYDGADSLIQKSIDGKSKSMLSKNGGLDLIYDDKVYFSAKNGSIFGKKDNNTYFNASENELILSKSNGETMKEYFKAGDGSLKLSKAGSEYLNATDTGLRLSNTDGKTYFSLVNTDDVKGLNLNKADGSKTMFSVNSETGDVISEGKIEAKGNVQAAGLTFDNASIATGFAKTDNETTDIKLASQGYVDNGFVKATSAKDDATMELINNDAYFIAHGISDKNANSIDIFSDEKGIMLTATSREGVGITSTLEVTSDGVFYRNGAQPSVKNEVVTLATAADADYDATEDADYATGTIGAAIQSKADASALADYAKLNDTAQTITSKAYVAGDWKLTQAGTGSLILGNTSAVNAVIFDKDLTAQHYKFGTNVFQSKASIATEGNFRANGQLTLGYGTNDSAVLTGAKIKAYDAAVEELPNKYNWSNITGAAATTDTAGAEEVSADTHVYSVAATDQKISDKANELLAAANGLFAEKQNWANKELGYDTNTTDAPTKLAALGFTPEEETIGEETVQRLGFLQAVKQNRALFEDELNPDTQEPTGKKLSVVDSIQKALSDSEQEIVAASVTADSLTLGESTPVTGTSGSEAAAIALDDNDMPYVAAGSDSTLATTASLNQAINNVLTFSGQTFNAKQQWLDAFTGLDSSKSNAEAFEEEFSGDTNLWVGNGQGEHPTNLAGVFHNINSALGTIHGLVDGETGKVNNTTSVFADGPITSELTGEEISTSLRAGTSVEDLQVDLDNAVAKIRSGETMVGKAFADQNGDRIDTTYAKLNDDATFKNITATESVATPKLVLNGKELTGVKTDAITKGGKENILATSSAVAATVKTMSEKATYTPGTGAVNTKEATTINEAILANDKVSSANKALLGELTATDNWANIKSLANSDNTPPATVVKAIQNVGNFIDNMDNKVGDLSALHPITNNADNSKAENLVIAINNFDDNLHNKTNTYTAAQAFVGGIKFSNAEGAQVVSAVDDGKGAVAVGEGKADTLATTATVLKSAQNAEFSAADGETLPDSINGAATIHAAIVNVATATDKNTKAIGDLDFSDAKNVEAEDLTEAVLDLDGAIGDLSTIDADYAKTNTESGSLNPADLATAIQNVATAAAKADGDLQFDNAYTKGEDGNQAADLTEAINNVAANAEAAAGKAKQYTDDRIDGTGADSEVTLGSNAGQVIIGKTQDNDGELEILSGIAINNDWNNREIEIATQHGNHVVGADFTAADETISLMASNKKNANATGMTIDNKNQTITLGTSNDVKESAYELEIDAKNGTTTIGTGKEGENVEIGKGTIVADASIAAGTFDENGALEEGVQMTNGGDLKATNSALIGSKDDEGNVSGVELTANGDITASGSATVKGNLSAANGDFTVATTTDDTDPDAPVTTTTMTLNGDANISGKATFGDAEDETKSVTIDEGTVTANEVDTKSLTADNGTFNETLIVGTADKGVSMNKDGELTATGLASLDGGINVNDRLTVDARGNLTTAGAGHINGGLTVGDNFKVNTKGKVTAAQYWNNNDTFRVNEGGELRATNFKNNDGSFSVSTHGAITGSEYHNADNSFTVSTTGNVKGNNFTATGNVTAKDGTVTGKEVVANEGFTLAGTRVTSIDTGVDAVEGDGSAEALATTATVMTSAENAKFTGATDENHATGKAETIKQAFQNIDTFVGSKETLTNKGISDKADLTTAFNSFADNVEAGMGGEFAEGGKWSAEISNEADAPEDGYYSAFTAENLAGAISTVYSTIGTADKLQGYNGVSAENTVNDNIAAVNGTVGNLKNLHTELKNLTNGTDVAPETVVEAFNNIDATLGRIHGLFDGKKVNTTGGIESTTGSHSNLAKGTTVEMHLVSLDNAIGDRSSITNENGSNGYVLVERDSVADVLSDIASQIGTAEDLAGATINGVSADNTVNQNIAAINSSLGDISELKDTAFAQGATLVDAVKNVDDKLVNLDNRVAKTERDLKELHHDFRRGMASMAAMSALVPNSRSTGKTSLSLGTGAYGGHGAVAVGGFHYLTDNLMLNAGVSWSDSSDTAYRMGVTYSF